MFKRLSGLLLLFLTLPSEVQAQSNYPPVIMTQPQSTTISQGQAIDLYVVAGEGEQLFYQWYFDGTPITGENETNLLITEATVLVTGFYYVVVTNNYGSVTSSEAFLAVEGPPVITTQPTNSAIFAGGSTTFNIVAGGVGPLHYQWLLNGTNLPDVKNIITTVTGNGDGGYLGDGGTSTNASLNGPTGVALDANGNIFIADQGNNVIREVEFYGTYGDYGIITTVAGNGNGGYSGDGGAATDASLGSPAGVAADANGNLFISEWDHHVIRKVDTNGIITTVAGSGNQIFSGDGGAATNADLNFPCGVAVDAHGNLFIADMGNNRIRKVDTNGIITTVAGGAGGYYGGYSGDGGAATNAQLNNPYGVKMDVSGNLFIADLGNGVIRKVNTNGIITTVAGNGRFGPPNNGGVATNSNLYSPLGVAVDGNDNIFIADQGNNLIEKVDTNGIIKIVVGVGGGSYWGGYSGDGGPATDAELAHPCDVIVDADKNLFIADQVNNRIREVVASGQYPTLTLTNATPNIAGNYQVVISNAFGSVTSSVVTLTVLPPIISIVPNADGSKTINLLTAPNVSSRVWVATNLTPPVVWRPVYTNIAGAAGTLQFTDTKTSAHPVQFYRGSTP
jgi:sugar lactone lactonase YvrE